MITVREELVQLNDMFKLLQEIHVEFQKLEQDNTKEQWYDDNDHGVLLQTQDT